MNPHDLLAADHQSLRSQASALKAAIEKSSKKLADELVSFQKSVQKHFKHEDIYYRVLDDAKRVPDRGLVHALRNDHAAVVFTLESLAIRLRKNGVTPDWRDRFDTLMAVFLPHLDAEEQSLFSVGKKMLAPEELAAITQQIDACDE
jgi:hemerythrin-like domain-containing protein